jgi:hypothetical protein
MDPILQQALDFSNYRQTLAIQRKTLKEQMAGKLTYAVNGGIFKVDRVLINFVQLLIDQGRSSGIVLLDQNENPILIEDLEKFKDEIFDGYAARIIQHEYDHIEGVLFTDHLSAIKKKLISKKLQNISKGEVSVDYRMKFPAAKKGR